MTPEEWLRDTVRRCEVCAAEPATLCEFDPKWAELDPKRLNLKRYWCARCYQDRKDEV